MKRLFFVASLAILAAACQKTEIQNEVQTPISFSTEVSKQTKAIVETNVDYPADQPFGVYAYGWQGGVANENPVMNNVEISYTEDPAKWAATITDDITVKYYWPNDPKTVLNFYAYSPAYATSNATPSTSLESHQVLTFVGGTGDGVAHTEAAGLKLTNYKHVNPYVDFMVGTPVIGATYAHADGDQNGEVTTGTIPTHFNHQMTQVVFKVQTDVDYGSDITFKVTDITLKNIKDIATYTNALLKSTYNEATFPNGQWDDHSITTADTDPKGTFNVYPATDVPTWDATEQKWEKQSNVTTGTAVNSADVLITYPVTMIPQTLEQALSAPTPGKDTYSSNNDIQMFAITYEISGTGVAEETITKHVPFNPYTDGTAVESKWNPNVKVTYVVKIGLKEITFEPDVAAWNPVNSYDVNVDQDAPSVTPSNQ